MDGDILSQIVDGASDSLAAFDRNLVVIAANGAFCRDFQRLYGRKIAVGDSLRQAFAGLPRPLALAQVLLNRVLAGERFRYSVELGLPHRHPQPYEFAFHPIRGEDGTITAAALIARDLGQSKDRFAYALDCAKAGTWRFEPSTGQSFWGEQSYRLLGCDPERDKPSFDLWCARMPPEDARRVRDSLRRIFSGRQEDIRLEYRIRHPEEGLVWRASYGRCLYGPNGIPLDAAGIIIDITETKQVQAALALARDEAVRATAELERAAVAKAHFLATISHDLRQPAQSLTLFAGLLHDRTAGTPLAALVQPMEQAVAAFNLLLNGLLDISLLDAGMIKAALVEIPLSGLFAQLREDYGPRAAALGLSLRVVDSRLRVRTDPRLLERILRHLLDNALRFTPHGGVVLGCRRHSDGGRGRRKRGGAGEEAGQWWIEVVDTGIGIAEPDRQRVFDEFYQVGNPSRDRSCGLGLGLAVVQRLARLIGSEVQLSSRPGKGSAFSLSVAPAQPAPSPGGWKEDGEEREERRCCG